MEKKFKIKLALLLTTLGVFGIIAIIPYSMTTLMSNQTLPKDIPISLVLTVNSIVQSLQLLFLVFIGVFLQNRVGLNAPILEAFVYKKQLPIISKKWMLTGIFVSFIGSVIILLLDLFVFMPVIQLPDEQAPTTVWWQGLLAMFYGGITEELMLRLFGMTLVVWILAQITKKEKGNIPDSYFYIAIFLTAILFGLSHLPATIQVFGELSTVIVIRAIVLNGLLGLWFGYLYWKKGLEYAIISHMSADFFIHVLFVSIL